MPLPMVSLIREHLQGEYLFSWKQTNAKFERFFGDSFNKLINTSLLIQCSGKLWPSFWPDYYQDLFHSSSLNSADKKPTEAMEFSVKGPTGAGKTTFIRRLLFDWAKGEPEYLQNTFDLVLKLRSEVSSDDAHLFECLPITLQNSLQKELQKSTEAMNILICDDTGSPLVTKQLLMQFQSELPSQLKVFILGTEAVSPYADLLPAVPQAPYIVGLAGIDEQFFRKKAESFGLSANVQTFEANPLEATLFASLTSAPKSVSLAAMTEAFVEQFHARLLLSIDSFFEIVAHSKSTANSFLHGYRGTEKAEPGYQMAHENFNDILKITAGGSFLWKAPDAETDSPVSSNYFFPHSCFQMHFLGKHLERNADGSNKKENKFNDIGDIGTQSANGTDAFIELLKHREFQKRFDPTDLPLGKLFRKSGVIKRMESATDKIGKQMDMKSLPSVSKNVSRYFYEVVRPDTTLPHQGTNPISFSLEARSDQFIDVNAIRVHVRCRIRKRNGNGQATDLVAADRCVLYNAFCYTLFHDLEINLQHRLLYRSYGFYDLITYLQLLTSVPKHTKQFLMTDALWFRDKAGAHSVIQGNNELNPSEYKRGLIPARSAEFEVEGRMQVDCFQVARRLPNGIGINIKFFPNQPQKCILAENDNTQFFIEIRDMYLTVPRIAPKPSLLNQPATIPYTLTQCFQMNVQHPTQHFGPRTILVTDNLPRRCFVIMISENQLNGSFTRNRLEFKHFNVDQVLLQVNGQHLPIVEGFKPDWDTDMYSAVYQALFQESNPDAIDFTKEEMKGGFNIFCFNIDQRKILSGGDLYPPKQSGAIDLTLHFKTATTENIAVLAFLESERVYKDKQKS